MALDGAMLYTIKTELEQVLLDARVDKVYQPSKEEIILNMRGKQGTFKVYGSIRVQSPRVHITKCAVENPLNPPMFCMLLRKHLQGAKLVSISQFDLERALYFLFSTYDELGKATTFTLVYELMGRNSNIILVAENGKVVDALKRVGFESSQRPVLPGVVYENPPKMEGKITLFSENMLKIKELLLQKGGSLVDGLVSQTKGASPLLCREIVYRSFKQSDVEIENIKNEEWDLFFQTLQYVNEMIHSNSFHPYILTKKDGLPFEFSFLPIIQYGLEARGIEKESLSILLDSFYADRDEKERMRQLSHDLHKVLQNNSVRISRKIVKQTKELENAKNREEKRIYGDLINSNISTIQKGASFTDVINYYDENCSIIRIPLDASKSPAQNAQKYYKEYRKAQTAEGILKEQIEAAHEELAYIETVQEALNRASSTKEIAELREELALQGYVRNQGKKQKGGSMLPPHKFISSDGFVIWVGRNNRQNDLLTLKTAHGKDLWLHTQKIPGSHVIIETRNQEVPETTIDEAAMLAAYHSKAKESSQVPVDYTYVKYVHKPAGAKPGKVIYEHQLTRYITPNMTIIDKLKA